MFSGIMYMLFVFRCCFVSKCDLLVSIFFKKSKNKLPLASCGVALELCNWQNFIGSKSGTLASCS